MAYYKEDSYINGIQQDFNRISAAACPNQNSPTEMCKYCEFNIGNVIEDHCDLIRIVENIQDAINELNERRNKNE